VGHEKVARLPFAFAFGYCINFCIYAMLRTRVTFSWPALYYGTPKIGRYFRVSNKIGQKKRTLCEDLRAFIYPRVSSVAVKYLSGRKNCSKEVKKNETFSSVMLLFLPGITVVEILDRTRQN
jgi:hypothetical protein